MKISREMTELLSKQVNEELKSAYLYQGMAIWANDAKYVGLSGWMSHQAQEEMEHAQKLNAYILERGGATVLAAVPAPDKATWPSPLECMKDTYDHENKVTEAFYKLAEEAQAARDYTTLEFLQWFIKEQTEEEAQCAYWVDRYELAGDNKSAQLFVDGEIGRRQA
ncbi:ferritin [Oscillospiraceae bacterium HV4-5-C5C]|nr:ferritin [Oscillospiraceae bacterium HV4-5-C5C]